jgi:hypothetical protein
MDKNGEPSRTLDGLKLLQNHVHGTITFTLQKRKNHRTVNLSILKRERCHFRPSNVPERLHGRLDEPFLVKLFDHQKSSDLHLKISLKIIVVTRNEFLKKILRFLNIALTATKISLTATKKYISKINTANTHFNAHAPGVGILYRRMQPTVIFFDFCNRSAALPLHHRCISFTFT